MLPNVWSIDEFKTQSNKIFSRRSVELQAIDRALIKAHTTNMGSDAGADAIIELLNAIAAWRKSKLLAGVTSGRARAVDTLQSQLTAVAELIYRRKIAEANSNTHPMPLAKQIVQENLQRFMQPKPVVPAKPPLPPRAGAATPPPPLPKRNTAQDRLFDVLAQSMLQQRAKAMGYDDEDLFDDLDAKQKGRLAAKWMLSVPAEVTDEKAARGEALRIIGAMLGNDVEVIKTLFENKMEVVVIPRDKGMTVLDQFKTLRGVPLADGRMWDTVRGVGNVSVAVGAGPHLPAEKTGRGGGSIVAIDPAKNKIYTAVTEENLLGGLTTAPGAGCYDTGYSTTTHEFAHAIQEYGLTDADRANIKRAYDERMRQPDTVQWVDGPRKVGAQTCYAANDEFEYFAQLSNAWLGTNTGLDPYTQRPRHNGRQWVLRNEPRSVIDVLERVYGQTAFTDLNPSIILKS